ncbi:hypothetical protein SLEP1_g15102 [Rubroshorea leprosula]|uniref:Uncharacterized protein n=1 Tax=Rubroshorea leprosula TaxID=152421 RepID=A0AAV5ILB7_9ROSI|nr:hypothetical protein SLEP1_g15102 [Rubroshorea leprosula]
MEDVLEKVNAWVCVSCIPVCCYNPIGLKRMGDKLGKVLKIDHSTQYVCRGRFVKFYVETKGTGGCNQWTLYKDAVELRTRIAIFEPKPASVGHSDSNGFSGVKVAEDFYSEGSQPSSVDRMDESAETSELEQRTKVLEMVMGRILSHLIPDDPLIPLLNRGDHLVEVVGCNFLALSNMVVLTKPRGRGKLNLEPSLSKLNEELLKKNNELEKQLEGMYKSIDELRSLRSCQQVVSLDSAPLSMPSQHSLIKKGSRFLI